MPIIDVRWVIPDERTNDLPIGPHAIYAWSVDFVRAMTERPLWAKLLFRFIVGKYAYREFVGLIDCLEAGGDMPFFGYGIESCDYHRDVLPIRWWEQRDLSVRYERKEK